MARLLPLLAAGAFLYGSTRFRWRSASKALWTRADVNRIGVSVPRSSLSRVSRTVIRTKSFTSPREMAQERFDGDPVLQWRAEQFERMSFNRDQAAWLAICSTVDLHDAADLAKRVLAKGDPIEVAFDVLAE